jgi:hypothetical protein
VKRFLAAIALALCAAGCERRPDPPSTPTPPGGGETITGSERLGWDQQASNAAELATFRYAIFVDGNRSEVAGVSCGTTAAAAGFPCSGRLPAMSAGAHALQLAAFVVRDGQTFESDRSGTLNVVVSGATAAERSAPTPVVGALIKVAGATTFRTDRIVQGLERPTDLAIAPDRRVFVAEASSRVSIVSGRTRRTALEPIPGTTILALTLDPQFARTRHVYVVRALVESTPAFVRLLRYREVGGTLGEEATLLDGVPASADQPAAALRFGPDGKLYAAFEGNVLRLNADGSTPRDQPSGRPIFAMGVRKPRGLDWDADGRLWIADRDGETRGERLLGFAGRPEPGVPHLTPAVSYPLPVPLGASSLAFHPLGDLLIGAEFAAHVLRIRFEPTDRLRVLGTERLLEGNVDAVRAVAAWSDGSVYLGTNGSLVVLVRAR